MNDALETPQLPEIPDYAYPPFVATVEDRERWRIALGLATELSRQNEPTGEPNSLFVFQASRSFYFSDVPTGDPDDPAWPTGETPR